MQSINQKCAIFIFSLGLSQAGIATEHITVFSCPGQESSHDIRADYDISLLRLALEKTIATHGPYQLNIYPGVNSTRAFKLIETDKYSNFIAKGSANKSQLAKFSYANFPVDLGIVGYRVFFVSPFAVKRLKKVQTLDQLKTFSIGQGIGWLDNQILKFHGFDVITASSFEGLFKMVSRGRFDLFPRGSNELLGEYIAHAHINSLLLDEQFILYYPLPRFFFSSKKNKAATQRIEEGLILAYEDHSLQNLWYEKYGASIDFINIKNRTIFKLENPFIKGIDTSYEKYIYTP